MARQAEHGGGPDDLEAYYGELLDEQEESGLSVAAFATEVGLSAATLYSWRRRLGRAGTRGGGAALIEISVKGEERSYGSQGRMVLAVSDGVRIELDAEFDESALERLLGVLDRC
jgi:transposase-like protein